jgi:hypothetical protein
MWGVVLLMAVGAGLTPARIGAVAFMLTRTKPMGLLVGYYVGGFGLSLITGVVLVFVLKDIEIGKGSSVPPAIEIAVGVLSLLVSVLVGTGVSPTHRQRVLARHPDAHAPAQVIPSSSGGSPEAEALSGFERLPNRVRAVLSKDSPWIAWVAGISVGTPNAYYLAAIAAILKSGLGAATQVTALVVFNIVAFAHVEIPIVAFLIAPEATRSRIQQLYTWISVHQRLLLTVLTGVVGVYLVIEGVRKR